jgi:hypothetical protein
MQEKCSFLLVHVEIVAILAVFLDAGGSNGTARYSFELGGYSRRLKVIRSKTLQAKKGRAIDGNSMEGIEWQFGQAVPVRAF